jgi:Ni,Fe-hydrogenase III small subunit
MLRDTKGATRPGEASSPRHAGVVIVTGCWSDDLAASVRLVVSQAPDTRRVVVVGDCALGRGVLAGRLRLPPGFSSNIRPDREVAGCPVETGRLLKEVHDVAG